MNSNFIRNNLVIYFICNNKNVGLPPEVEAVLQFYWGGGNSAGIEPPELWQQKQNQLHSEQTTIGYSIDPTEYQKRF